MYRKLLLICGMPRSGTSWLGQILDSSNDVAFRMEPLFSYRFKNIINEQSSEEDVLSFFEQVYLADDGFMNQEENRRKGAYTTFEKTRNPACMVVKTTRHHNLLRKYLESVPGIEIVSIIRHPCAAISSWICADREFRLKGCSIENDWRTGACRKDGPGEYWGFLDWLLITKLHTELALEYDNFSILKYSDLVEDMLGETRRIFDRLSLPVEQQTLDFLRDCRSSHNDDPYSVFKNAKVKDQWRVLLDPKIAQQIIEEADACGLNRFLD